MSHWRSHPPAPTLASLAVAVQFVANVALALVASQLVDAAVLAAVRAARAFVEL